MIQWKNRLTERQRQLLDWSAQYAQNPFGDDGHNAKLLIAKMSSILDSMTNGNAVSWAAYNLPRCQDCAKLRHEEILMESLPRIPGELGWQCPQCGKITREKIGE